MIAAETLNRVAARAGELHLSDDGIAHLRREFAGIHFTLCNEDDVPARLNPALAGEGFDLYLISNAEHCIAFTTDPAAATGIVVAERSED